MIEIANVVTRDVLQTQMTERLQALEQGKQELVKLEKQVEQIKANMVAIDGAAQQLKILIDLCDTPQSQPEAPVQPDSQPADGLTQEETDRVKEILTKPTVLSPRD